MRVNQVGTLPCLTSLVLVTLSAVGCIPSTGSSGPTVTKSTDGRFQVTMPAGWRVHTDLHDDAELQIADARKEKYLIVLTESKADLEDPTIKWHSELTRSAVLESLKAGEIAAGPKTFQINGQQALQYEIRGMTDGLKVVYIHTTVETEEHLHQILAWTLPSQYDSNIFDLNSAINSFRAVPKTSTP